MAVAVVGWVFAHSRSRNGQRLVMLAIADACNSPDGTGAWLSNAALCAKSGLSERAVQVAVRECERLGELAVERGQGRGGVNRFRVLMAVDNPVDNSEKGAESAGFQERAQNLRGAESAGVRTDEAPQVKPGKGAESAGQRSRQKGAESAPGTVSTSLGRGSSSSGRSTGGSRGTRLPADFGATPEMIAWARQHTPNVGIRETEAFVDHFTSAPGQKGVKLDWLATWRNWMRREQKRHDEQVARDQRYTERRNGPSAPKPVPAAERCEKHPTYRRDRCGPCRSERGATARQTNPGSRA